LSHPINNEDEDQAISVVDHDAIILHPCHAPSLGLAGVQNSAMF
jgi:hypothetical protein